MKTTQSGIDMIKQFEGVILHEYKDAVGIPTIGYGHTGGVTPGMRITQAQAEDLLKKDLAKFEAAVDKYVTVDINQNQFNALVSFSFNCGAGALAKSTLLKKVNAKDWKGAAAEFAKWNKAGGEVLAGLTKRRAAEAAMFLKPMPVLTKPALKPYAGQLLTRGMMDNPYVKLAQGRLHIQADGDFGNGTYTTVRNFQARHGLHVDGIIGQKTWNAIFK